MPSSAQLKLAVNNLVARLLILTQLACADTTSYTQFSLKAKLQLKNKLLPVGGWLGGWVYRLVGGAAGEIENKAISAQPTELELDRAGLSLATRTPYQNLLEGGVLEG